MQCVWLRGRSICSAAKAILPASHCPYPYLPHRRPRLHQVLQGKLFDPAEEFPVKRHYSTPADDRHADHWLSAYQIRQCHSQTGTKLGHASPGQCVWLEAQAGY